MVHMLSLTAMNLPQKAVLIIFVIASVILTVTYLLTTNITSLCSIIRNPPQTTHSTVTFPSSSPAEAVTLTMKEVSIIHDFMFKNLTFAELHAALWPPVSKPSKGTLTRTVHQSWRDRRLIPMHRRLQHTWKWCFPEWKYRFWTDSDNRALIMNHFPWFLSTYDKFPENIFRADAMRYFYLYLFGGLYTDLDNECLKPFEHLLEGQSLVFGEMESGAFKPNQTRAPHQHDYIQNSLMYSIPRHPFWLLLIRAMLWPESRSLGSWTGSYLVSRHISSYETMTSFASPLRVYPAEYFNPFSWQHNSHPIPNNVCKTFNKMTTEDYMQCRKYFTEYGSFVVQYHSHTW